MIIERIESRGLAHYSWFVCDDAEAVVIDPRRDVEVYLNLLRQHRATLSAVIETHRHEDFASGAAVLARRTGAQVLHGVGLPWTFGVDIADGDDIPVGRARLHVMATPGHTVESICLVLTEPGGSLPLAVFTGDLLLAGSVGRIDLYGRTRAEANAREQYASLQRRLLPLGDGVGVFPCHGRGTISALSLVDRPITTIGHERATNPLLSLEEEPFVRARLAEPHMQPPSFLRMERWNLNGSPGWVRGAAPRALTPEGLEAALGQGARIVDARSTTAFAGGHIPGALSIALSSLAKTASWLLGEDRPLVLVLPDEAEPQAALAELARIGLDHVVGYLAPGFDTWVAAGRPTTRLSALTPGELGMRRASGWGPVVLDVRGPADWLTGTLPDARLMFLGDVPSRLHELPRDRPVVVTCNSGPRGFAGASLLVAAGHPEVHALLGGMSAARGLGWNLPKPDMARIEAALAQAPLTHRRAQALEGV